MEASFDYSASYSGALPMWAIVVWAVLVIFFIYCGWKLFVKAGQPGWAAIIPIYNYYIVLKMVGRPWWHLLLFLIPFVNLIIAIMVVNDLSKCFGKGIGYTLGLLFLSPIFMPMLALGNAKYTAPKKA